jgi:hypothetical protein
MWEEEGHWDISITGFLPHPFISCVMLGKQLDLSESQRDSFYLTFSDPAKSRIIIIIIIITVARTATSLWSCF